MRAIVVEEPGGPDQLYLREVPAPEPKADELLVQTQAIGVNFIDVYHRIGRYRVPLPFTPGQEGAGRVLAVGADVAGFEVGQEVGWTGTLGTYAEEVAVPARAAIPLPVDLSPETAAASLSQGMTAQYLTTASFVIQPGHTALVHAAAGGVGLLLTQFIKAAGGRVIGTVSSAAKEKLARNAGADHVLRYDGYAETAELAAAVRGLAADGTDGVDVVYDGVGAATFEASLASLRRRGTLVLFGGSSGPVPPFDLQRLSLLGSLTVIRPTIVDYVASRAELLERADGVLAAVRSGALHVTIGQRYPLADVRRAHEDLEARRTVGKTLLMP